MVATVATASLFPTSSPQPDSGAKNSGKHHGLNSSVDVRGIKSKSTSSGGMQVKTNAQAPTKVNGTRVGVMDGLKTDDNSSSAAPRTFINQLPDWSMLLAAITTIFLAAEKQWMMLDWKTKRPDILADLDPFGFGRIVEDGIVFRQNFSIRSYEIGADRTASVETLMNHLQETALNHVKTAGLMGDGFGSTPEMSKKNLFWVVTKMQVLVDHYPTWGDVVQVDTWVAASRKNGMRRDWLIRDCRTGEILTRASSNWVMMNKVRRRLSKIPDEVRAEIEQYFVDTPPVIDDDNIKLPKLDENIADHVRSGLTPKWSDLDVNNVKYVGWILELSLSASNLRDRDVLSKSDPMAVIYSKGRDGSLQEIGHTEVVLNSFCPQWIKKVIITYQFEVVQTLLFRVYDVDTQFHGVEEKVRKRLLNFILAAFHQSPEFVGILKTIQGMGSSDKANRPHRCYIGMERAFARRRE